MAQGYGCFGKGEVGGGSRHEAGRERPEVEVLERDRRVWNPGTVTGRKDGGGERVRDEMKGRKRWDGGASNERGVRDEASFGTTG